MQRSKARETTYLATRLKLTLGQAPALILLRCPLYNHSIPQTSKRKDGRKNEAKWAALGRGFGFAFYWPGIL